MRPAQAVMADLASSGLSAEQLALVMELSAAVATEARPVADKAAENKREYDRQYRRERRNNRTKSYDNNDKHDPPKENTQTPGSVSDETGASADPVKELFDLGVAMLKSQGHSEPKARSIVGGWRKGRSPGEVVAALVDAKTRSISNLVEWMPKRLTAAARSPPNFLEHYEREVELSRSGGRA